MHNNPKYHLKKVNPEEGEIDTINDKFDIVRLSFVVDEDVDRAQNYNNVVDQKVFFHDLTICEEGLLLLGDCLGVNLWHIYIWKQVWDLVVNWDLRCFGFEINELFDFWFLGLLDFVNVIKLFAERLF